MCVCHTAVLPVHTTGVLTRGPHPAVPSSMAITSYTAAAIQNVWHAQAFGRSQALRMPSPFYYYIPSAPSLWGACQQSLCSMVHIRGFTPCSSIYLAAIPKGGPTTPFPRQPGHNHLSPTTTTGQVHSTASFVSGPSRPTAAPPATTVGCDTRKLSRAHCTQAAFLSALQPAVPLCKASLRDTPLTMATLAINVKAGLPGWRVCLVDWPAPSFGGEGPVAHIKLATKVKQIPRQEQDSQP